MALKMILVKVDITGIAFVLGVKEDTILFWLDRAYKKANEINQALLKELPVTRVELDEMWSFVRRKTNNGADWSVSVIASDAERNGLPTWGSI
ncbi:hypothetical protein [Desulfobacter latus]|uniref:Uncharacterized protein n=1 Tax=Desulfobacter latus TaxID=2292 RepID=A0A850T7B9_9BACT|nr:hypothetical protein [Desulfobacter latus]NWH05312.1 hypothetical protein [Desulfobacter latus]